MDSLSSYWSVQFPEIWRRVLEPILTRGGKYKMDQLELIPRWIKKGGEDIMARHVIFKTSDELLAYVSRCRPDTLQLGGIFPMTLGNYESRHLEGDLNRAGVFSVYSPLKIDLDIKDYNRTNVCACKKEDMCITCWEVCMHSSRLIIDFILRSIFGFSKIYHFWSGNRGLHIWCFDDRVWEWTKIERTRILNIIKRRELVEHLMPEHLCRMPWPHFDDAVTADPIHPLGLPFGPHHKTRCIRIMLPLLADPKKFDPQHQKRISILGKVVLGDLQHSIRYMIDPLSLLPPPPKEEEKNKRRKE